MASNEPIPNLEELAETVGISAEDLLELIGVFFETAADTVPALEAAYEADDLETAARHAHSIRGGAATVALHKIALCAAALETALRSSNRPEVDVDLPDLRREIETAAGRFNAPSTAD